MCALGAGCWVCGRRASHARCSHGSAGCLKSTLFVSAYAKRDTVLFCPAALLGLGQQGLPCLVLRGHVCHGGRPASARQKHFCGAAVLALASSVAGCESCLCSCAAVAAPDCATGQRQRRAACCLELLHCPHREHERNILVVVSYPPLRDIAGTRHSTAQCRLSSSLALFA